jgi:hydrogenase nickel incorporation protein HypA/HybF
MHEISMMQNLLNTAIERAQTEGAQHIRLVQMRVGDASGVTPDFLRFAFEVAKQGTIAENAQIQIDRVPTLCYCLSCHLEFSPIDEQYECPQCHQNETEIRQGKECDLAALEVS